MQTNANPVGETMQLYSAWYCPFAQRAWMTLLLKGMPFEYTEVDPYQTSGWWLMTSRGLGKVPVLVVPAKQGAEAITVVDSTGVVEYLEERAPDVAPLFPTDPEARAETRFWIDHVNERIVPYLYRFLDAHEPGPERDDARVKLTAGIEGFGAGMSPVALLPRFEPGRHRLPDDSLRLSDRRPARSLSGFRPADNRRDLVTLPGLV